MDTNNDGKADMQFVIEYPKERTGEVWPNGHYMIMFDLDRDNIFNYINWNNFTLQCWERRGLSDFYEDYSGQTSFLKIHTSTYDMKDLRFNWENPFCSMILIMIIGLKWLFVWLILPKFTIRIPLPTVM